MPQVRKIFFIVVPILIILLLTSIFTQSGSASGLDLNDQTANGHNLTNNGATEVTTGLPFTQSTEAVSLDGSDDYLTTPDTADLSVSNTHQLTIEFWVKVSSLNNNNVVISKNTASNYEYKLTVGKADGSIEYNVFSLDGNNRYTGTSVTNVISAGTWYHIAFVIDDSGTYAATNAKVYVNGTEISYGTQLGNSAHVLGDGSAPLEIGRYSPGSNYFNGEVDDVRIWNTARTSTQINDNMNKELAGTDDGLVAYYPFENKLQSKINYYAANVSNFSRSTTPFSSGIATQTDNTDGSVTTSINSTSSYADSGIVLYEGTLANLPNFTVKGTGDPYSLNIWIDSGGDGDFFAWDGNGNLTGLNGDTYALGPSSSSGTDAITGSTQFYLMSDSTNHTFSDLKAGNVSGINPSDKVAVWIGVNTTSGSTSSTIDSVSGL